MYLGIDVGTTAVKAVLLDATQQQLAAATIMHRVQAMPAGVSEIVPQKWLDSVHAALVRLRAAVPEAYVHTRAIGLSGQMHSLVLLGSDQKPLCPAILWNDARGEAEARALRTDVPDIGKITGVEPTPGFTAAKLLWLRRNHPALFGQVRHVLWAKDFVRHWLSGLLCSDYSDAAGGQLLDEAHWRWADTVLAYLGLDATCLPKLLAGPAVSGHLQTNAAQALGLTPGIPIATGGGDTATTALGLGCINQGNSFISLGTGTLYAQVQNRYSPHPDQLNKLIHTFAHCVPERWYSMAAMLNGASSLAWLAGLVGKPDVGALLKRTEALGQAPGKVLFQPYLYGERTPHNNTQAKAAWLGMDASCTVSDLTKAVLEGVAFSLRQGQNLLGIEPALTAVAMVGGGTRSRYWVQLIANVLERPVKIVYDANYTAAQGAARLGLMAAENASLHAVACTPQVRQTIDPQNQYVQAYKQRYQAFLQMYPVTLQCSANR